MHAAFPRRSMIFLQRPISLGLLCVAALLLGTMVVPFLRKSREAAFQE